MTSLPVRPSAQAISCICRTRPGPAADAPRKAPRHQITVTGRLAVGTRSCEPVTTSVLALNAPEERL
jgi:hypothetical protein